jgi:Na+/H+ antiporter NhaB
MFDKYLKQLNLDKITSQPQVRELLTKIKQFWVEYGQKVKLAAIGVIVLTIILVAVSLGRNLASLNQPQETNPQALPTVAITPESEKVSIFIDLKQQITDFSPLLPDPAPPSVDPNITLQEIKR